MCPVCHYQLPDGWRDGHAICIAMAGARATGKSLYIAVLVKQLELLCENLGVSMEPATRATATAYSTHYETPLFAHRGLDSADADSAHSGVAAAGTADFQHRHLAGRAALPGTA